MAPQVHVDTTLHSYLFCLLLVDSMNINLLVMRICLRTMCHKSVMIMKLLFAAFSCFLRSWNVRSIFDSGMFARELHDQFINS